jgi:ATP-binding cassette subfamily B protein
MTSVRSPESLDQTFERRLVSALDQGPDALCTDSVPGQGAVANPLLRAVGVLAMRHGTRFETPGTGCGTGEAGLRLALTRSGLLWRDVLIHDNTLHGDCGDLIGLMPEAPFRPVLLLSEADGYHLWEPSGMARPVPFKDRWQRMGRLPGRMLAIQPALPDRGLNARKLVRFTNGPASQSMPLIVSGAILGLLLGFSLAIGLEADAAQWIFGVGAAGLLLGVSLAILSNGFRLAVITSLLGTLLGFLLPIFNTILTNEALPNRDLALVLQLGGVLLAAAIAEVCLQWTQALSLLAIQLRGAMRLPTAALDRLLKLPTSFSQRFGAGELALRFDAISQLNEELQTLLSGGLLKSLLSLLYLLFMLKISKVLTALAVALALLLLIPTAVVGWQSRRFERRRESAAAEASSRNLELISSVAKLRVAGAETRAARHWGEAYSPSVAYAFALDARAAISELLQTCVPGLGQLLLYMVIARLIAEAAQNPGAPAPDLGELLGFFSAFGVFIGSMVSMADLAVGAFDLPVLVERARPILMSQPERQREAIDHGELKGAVALEEVWFRYGPEQDAVLKGVTLHAEPGECLAIVGPSGSGKSTIIRLLLGLDDPETGEVRYDGRALAELRIDRVRAQIGCVLQDARLFAGSIQEAIAAGSLISPEQAWQAAERAAIADDIRAMPMQMHTVLPEGGGTLSGGQRQRLAIARALARSPRVLIFDEATSALDNRTQRVVADNLHGLPATRILVAHRLSTIRQADRIVVLEEGRISQQGTFAELLQQPGPFTQLMARQEA